MILTPAFLVKRRGIILADLLAKVEAEDWHGVQDCASDIREIEAQLKVLENQKAHREMFEEGLIPDIPAPWIGLDEEPKPEVGWYAFTYCGELEDGLYANVGRWNGKAWRFAEQFAQPWSMMWRSPERFETKELALSWADAHDPEAAHESA